jgi:4-hydroxy-3-polyprenylbenzoate decarboxylase
MSTGSNKISKVIVAVTGASGAIYGFELIKQLTKIDSINSISVIFSENGLKVWEYENKVEIPKSEKINILNNNDLFASPASGSSGYQAMFITPCSMGTLGSIAAGISNTLILRAADVMLKERKTLILMTREAPLSLIHIENMGKVTRSGAIIFPASPFFYNHPKDLNAAISALISRLINTSGIPAPIFEWDKK